MKPAIYITSLEIHTLQTIILSKELSGVQLTQPSFDFQIDFLDFLFFRIHRQIISKFIEI